MAEIEFHAAELFPRVIAAAFYIAVTAVFYALTKEAFVHKEKQVLIRKESPMRSRFARPCSFALLFLVATSIVPPAWASITYTSETLSLPYRTGQLNYTLEHIVAKCTAANYYVSDQDYNFVYVSPTGTQQPISGSTYITRYPAACGGQTYVGSQITYNGSGFTIIITPGFGGVTATISGVAGFLNPKFIIAVIMYAPPGSSSTATYSQNTVLGSSSSISGSFSNENAQSVSDTVGLSIPGFSASETSTYSNSFTQEQDSSASLAINQTTSLDLGVDGYSDPVKGVNHDYDHIKVWLNPIIQLTTYGSNSAAVWNGYGYDLNDGREYPDMDVADIQLGCLNGDFYGQYAKGQNTNWLTCEDVINNRFDRSWALNNQDGSGPALTPTLANSSPPYNFCQQQGTDLYNVCQADPFSNPTYTVSFPSGSYTTTDGRFTACHNSNCSTTIDYSPGVFTKYSQGYSITATQSEGSKVTYQVGLSVEAQEKAGWFVTLSTDLKNSNTLTWVSQFSQSTNNTQGQTASFSVQGPAEGYTGPTSFVVYQDNLFGTFMFYPGN